MHHEALPVITSGLKGTRTGGLAGTLYLYRDLLLAASDFRWYEHAERYLTKKPETFPLRDAILDCTVWMKDELDRLDTRMKEDHATVLADWKRVHSAYLAELYARPDSE